MGAALAAVWAAGLPLLGCLGVALAGWFASGADAHGDTLAALRVGADAWLLGHGSGLALGPTTVSAVPLGITGISVLAFWRAGRRAGRGCPGETASGLALGVAVLAAVAAAIATVVAVLASTPDAEPNLGRVVVGAVLVALVGGGPGLAQGSGRTTLGALPREARLVLRAGLAALLVLVAAASVLVAVAFLSDLGAAANVLARLHVDVGGGLLYTAVVAAAAPNAVLLGVAYLLGAGFAVGTGTVVAPTLVDLGPVPAFPLLAALPGSALPPWLSTLLLAVPALAAALGTGLVLRGRSGGWARGALLGLCGGLVGAVLTTLCVQAAGGAVGPGRMADVGADAWPVLGQAALSLGLGGAVAGLALGWWEGRTTGRGEPRP
jgi:hypothetical protein